MKHGFSRKVLDRDHDSEDTSSKYYFTGDGSRLAFGGKMKRVLGVISAFFLGVTASNANGIEGSTYSYGNWWGMAYVSEQTGAFSHCAISANYLSGLGLIFSISRDLSVGIGVAGPLNLVEGQAIPVSLHVDNRPPFFGQANAISEDFAALHIVDFDSAMSAFQRGRTLRLDALGNRFFFDLTGTFRALDATQKCVQRYFNYQKQSVPAASRQIDRTAMFQLSTQIISALGISDARYLTEAELADLGWSNTVVWESDGSGVNGISMIVPLGEEFVSLRATDPEDTAFIALSCDGDYATSARSLGLEGISEARELRLLCTEEQGVSEVYLSKLLGDNHIVYNILLFSATHSSTQEDRRKSSEAAALQAASFVVQN